MLIRTLLVAAAFVAPAMLAGCSSNAPPSTLGVGYKTPKGPPDSPGTQHGTGPDDGGSTTPVGNDLDAGAPPPPPPGDDGGTGATACNQLDNAGAASVQSTNTFQNPPQPVGGSVLDGVFTLTNVTHYGGGGQKSTYQGVVRVQSAVLTMAVIKDGQETRSNYTIQWTGANMTQVASCGANDTTTFSYSAAVETSFTLYDNNNNAFTYTQ